MSDDGEGVAPEFTEADERAWVTFATSLIYQLEVKVAADQADRMLAELRKRRTPERKEGPYR